MIWRVLLFSVYCLLLHLTPGSLLAHTYKKKEVTFTTCPPRTSGKCLHQQQRQQHHTPLRHRRISSPRIKQTETPHPPPQSCLSLLSTRSCSCKASGFAFRQRNQFRGSCFARSTSKRCVSRRL